MFYFVSAYGFFRKTSWAYALATIANVMALQFSFWPSIPAMDMGLPPVHFLIFLPNGIIFLLLHKVVGKRSWGQTLVGLVAGMALVTSWINGTASLNITWKITEGFLPGDSTFYILASRLHWLNAISFGVICVGIFLFPKKEWIRMLGLGMGLLEIVLGTPMGITTTISKDELSLYLAAPFFSALLFFLFFFPKLWEKFLKLGSEREGKSWMIYTK